jgi:hypothetical protein
MTPCLLLRHASSRKRAMAVMAPNETFGLAEEAASLGVTYMDVDAIKAFNKNKKEIKRWGTLTQLLPSTAHRRWQPN